MPTATLPKRAKKSDQFTTIRLRVDSRKALGQICRTHGVKSWRAMELLVDGWNELTDEQRGRIFAK